MTHPTVCRRREVMSLLQKTSPCKRPWGWGRLGLRCKCSHRIERSAAGCTSQGSARDDGVTPTTRQGDPMTYNRLEAKPMAGEHCRFCRDASAPLVKTPCCQQRICCDTALFSLRGGGRCQVEHERFSMCYSHYED